MEPILLDPAKAPAPVELPPTCNARISPRGGLDILSRAEKAGVSAKAHLADNDGYSFFDKLDSLLVTGPTLTNVNDFRAILIV